MEPESKHILAVTVSKERTMLIAERFILSLTNRYGIHPVSTEMVDVVSTTSL
jgi:putative transposase